VAGVQYTAPDLDCWSGRRESNPRPQSWQGGGTRPHSPSNYSVLLFRPPSFHLIRWVPPCCRAVYQEPAAAMAQIAPSVATIGPVVTMELERVEALELLGMTLAHLNEAEARAEISPRVALLMAIRDKLALGLREDK
jgi:predicted DNA-binding protein (UPF0251 family)